MCANLRFFLQVNHSQLDKYRDVDLDQMILATSQNEWLRSSENRIQDFLQYIESFKSLVISLTNHYKEKLYKLFPYTSSDKYERCILYLLSEVCLMGLGVRERIDNDELSFLLFTRFGQMLLKRQKTFEQSSRIRCLQ